MAGTPFPLAGMGKLTAAVKVTAPPFFNTDRGYGFIAPDDGGSDVFVHAHDVEAAGMNYWQQANWSHTKSASRELKGGQSSKCLTPAASSSRTLPLRRRASPHSRVSVCGLVVPPLPHRAHCPH
jgi:cold shock CspA family protein